MFGAALLLAACSGSSGKAGGSGGAGGGGAAGAGGGQVVGTSGGAVMHAGVALSIPANALGADTPITISQTTAPPGYAAASAAYEFGPSGTTFAQPVAVTIPLDAPTPGAHVFWSNAGGGFDDVGGTVNGTSVTAFVTHFSVGFCAVPATDAGAGDAAADGEATGSGGQGGTAGAGGAGGSTGTGGTTGAGGGAGGGVAGAGGASGAGGAGGAGGAAGQGGAADGGDAGSQADAAASDAASNLCAGTPLNLPLAKVTNVEAGAAPAGSTYTGGTITSGKHYLTAVSHYGGGSYTGSTRAAYTIDATAGTIQIGEFTSTGSAYVGMTFTNLDAHTLQVNVVCNTGATVPTATQYYYTFGPSGSGSSLTMTEVGSSDVLTIGPP